MTLGERIRMARGHLSQDAFCARLGISKGALGFYERDENMPRVDVAARICEVAGVSLAWLVYGDGDTASAKPAEENGVISLPLREARIRPGDGLVETGLSWEAPPSCLAGAADVKNLFAMRVDGDSMAPEIRDGDCVLVDTSLRAIRLGRLFAVAVGEVVYIRRLEMSPDQLVLSSAGNPWQPVEPQAGLRILGEVVWLSRDCRRKP